MKKKIVFKVQQSDKKCWSKFLGKLADADGVISSIAWEGEDKIVVIGEKVGASNLEGKLKKKVKSAKIEKVDDIKKEKKLKMIVFKVQQSDRKCWSKALGILDAEDGVISSIAWEGKDKIVVVGDDVNPAKLNAILEKKFDSANIEEVLKEDTEILRMKYEELTKKYEELTKNYEGMKKKYKDKKKDNEILGKKPEKVKKREKK